MKLRVIGFLGVAALGCSDPAAPPAVGGATVNLSTLNPPVAGKQCPGSGDPIYLGQNGIGPTGTAKGRPFTDDEGASVSCSIGSGSNIKFSGLIQKGGGFFQVSGSVQKGGTGNAVVSVYDPGSTDILTSPNDQLCTVSVADKPLVVGEEAIWASYTCPALASSDNLSVACSVDTGWFFFDHCK
ncbi:MAG: hypothetical protein U0263_31630 [Polyangiaceae bacterium]